MALTDVWTSATGSSCLVCKLLQRSNLCLRAQHGQSLISKKNKLCTVTPIFFNLPLSPPHLSNRHSLALIVVFTRRAYICVVLSLLLT